MLTGREEEVIKIVNTCLDKKKNAIINIVQKNYLFSNVVCKEWEIENRKLMCTEYEYNFENIYFIYLMFFKL